MTNIMTFSVPEDAKYAESNELSTEVLLSDEIIDLPPVPLNPEDFTADQAALFADAKEWYTDVYEAFTRFNCGQPAALDSWDKRKREEVLAAVDYYTCLYKLINFGWQELKEGISGIDDSPGEAFIHLLRNESLGVLMPSLADCYLTSVSPQGYYRTHSKVDAFPIDKLTEADLAIFNDHILITDVLRKSKSPAVIKARRDFQVAASQYTQLVLRRVNPAKRMTGWQWKDGKQIPNEKHRRNRNNQPSE
jgi:hypothetical protein